MPKMNRLAGYVAGSTALAVGVVSWAFYSRPNFYSAAVYLSHSNFCLLVLCNLGLLSFISVLWLLQRIFFGPLRQIEIEQLYERGWITGTEWLFAISIFRDEFSLWCLSMFVVLFFSKIWGWIAEGRIEALEQQQPTNRRLYHARLIASLAVYIGFSAAVTKYCLDEVIYDARPGVMIMFLFEFMIITIGAVSTSAKYALWAYEHRLLSKQHEERVAMLRREAIAEGRDPTDINEEDMDIHDLDLLGWEAKGTWQFGVDICSDFLKLVAYMGFFGILTVFYGLPIYIIRDLFMTTRSFVKRVHDYQKYQSATRNMHALYPDATVEELAADNTCIVCREEMHPWHGGARNAADNADGAPRVVSERQRPKKLPCGHILHFACLRSWLERQQACPTCRRSVLEAPDQQRTTNNRAGRNGARGAAADGNQADRRNNDANRRNRRRNYFRFRLGDLRVVIGANRVAAGEDPAQAVQNAVHDAELPHDQEPPSPNGDAQQADAAAGSDGDADASITLPTHLPTHMRAPWRATAIHAQLTAIEEALAQDIQAASIAMERAARIRQLQAELGRLQTAHAQSLEVPLRPYSAPAEPTAGPSTPAAPQQQPNPSTTTGPAVPPGFPENVVLPDGWRIVPLVPAAPTQAPLDAANPNPLGPIPYQHLPYMRAMRSGVATLPMAPHPTAAPPDGLPGPPPGHAPPIPQPRMPIPMHQQLFVMPSGEVIAGHPALTRAANPTLAGAAAAAAAAAMPGAIPGAMPGGGVPSGFGTPVGPRSAAATPPPQQLFNAQQQMAHAMQLHEHNMARLMQQQQVRMSTLRAQAQQQQQQQQQQHQQHQHGVIQAAGQAVAENGQMTPPVDWRAPIPRRAPVPWNTAQPLATGLAAQRETAPQNPERGSGLVAPPANSGVAGPSVVAVAPTPTVPVDAPVAAAPRESVAPREPVTGNGSAVASGSTPSSTPAGPAEPKEPAPTLGSSTWNFDGIEPEASGSTSAAQNGSASQARGKQPTVEDSEDMD